MLRALHVGCKFIQNVVTMQDNLSDILQSAGAFYSKMDQFLGVYDGDESRYNETKQVNEHETLQELLKYLVDHDILYKTLEFKASGSIAALYICEQLSGIKIALKIKYVGIRELWEQDICMLSVAIYMNSVLQNTKESTHIVKQMHNMMERELDFVHEAKITSEVYTICQFQPFITPKVHHELCTNNVLPMSIMEGICVSHAKLESEDIRNMIVTRLLQFDMFMQFNGYVYADYHYGNLRYFSDIMHIGVMDFGAMQRMSSDELVKYRKSTLSVLHDDLDEYIHVNDLQDALEWKSYWDISKLTLQPYLKEGVKFDDLYLRNIAHTESVLKKNLDPNLIPSCAASSFRGRTLLFRLCAALEGKSTRELVTWTKSLFSLPS
jgi:hypothetical protein